MSATLPSALYTRRNVPAAVALPHIWSVALLVCMVANDTQPPAMSPRLIVVATLVVVLSEMGRTPKINKDSGRDHWARCYSNLLAGGGFHKGLIYGASDSTAAEPARDAVTLEDLMFTVYHQLGIDADKELVAFGTRPIEIIKDGKLVKGLIESHGDQEVGS